MSTEPSADFSLPIVRAIAEYTYDWESWIGPDRRLRWVNGAVERISGYSVDACMRMPGYPLPMVHEDDRARIAALLATAAAGSEGNDVEFRVVRRDGVVRWVAVSWQPIVGDRDEVLGYRASIRDIDERKTMEARLRAMRERAENADRAKTELLANVSHELRTPAHCVAGFAELLLETGLEGRAARYAEIIRGQATLLLRQVEDLLDMASLESGGIRLEQRPLDVHQLVRDIVIALEPAATQAATRVHVVIDPSAPRVCVGDELRLSQVVRNLVENAIHHADAAAIEVRVASPDAGSGVAIEVRDEGRGIPADRLAEITRPFVQLDGSRARRRGGAGLGLSICDRLVRAMGGAMTIASAQGRGTTVRVVLPLAVLSAMVPDDARTIATSDGALADRLPLAILVVDDTPESQELLCEQLVRLGYAPERASSGREAIARVETLWPDLVLLDVQMPEIDGADVARRIRALCLAHPERPRPRVVAVTAGSFAAGADAGLAIDAMLVKPVTRARLSSLLVGLATPQAAGPGAGDEGELL
ncbi:MAG TPA: ATP-binding protein, partial [Nannocystaceae bacterium]|nr:ATP-binding protein [Nannocystaceae bacterium]